MNYAEAHFLALYPLIPTLTHSRVVFSITIYEMY